MIRTAILATVALVVLSSSAEARRRAIVADPGCNVIFPCEGVVPSPRGQRIAREMGFGAAQKVYTPKPVRSATRPAIISGPAQIVSHPPGCPSRAFCACGAAVRVFGAPVRSLWLAASWFKFPRAEPAPGNVAVRRHHVFVLERHIGVNVWMAYDANSGRRLTRIHARSIAGYVIVNPHGSA